MSETATETVKPRTRRTYWQTQAMIRQRIIEKQDKTIANLTASVVQLETDYDTVEAELRSKVATNDH